MTNTNYDTALLEACKHYIRITETNPKMFITELCGLAEEYCQKLPENILEFIETDSERKG